VGDETAYGALPQTPVGRKCYISTFELVSSQNQLVSPIISGGRGKRMPSQGNIAVAGTVNTTIAPETMGFWLKHALGAPVTTGTGEPAAAPWTHTFRPKALPVGFWAAKDYETKLADKVELFNGCRIASMDMAFPQEGPATFAMQILGKSHSIITAPPDASIDDPGHNEFSGFEGIVKIGGTQVGGVTSLTLRLDNEMPGGPYVFPATGASPGYRGSNPEGQAAISGTIETVFEDFSLFDAALASTDTTFEVILSRGDGDGTVGDEKVSFLIDHSLIARASPPLNTASGMLVSLSFNGFASGATDMGLVVVLLNSIAAAAL
jgi:hypothetical protein